MSDDESKPTAQTEEKPKPEWQNRQFRINDKMQHVVKLGMAATEAEITLLKRKLGKLQYGS